MQSTPVVVPLDEFLQPVLQVPEITVRGRVDLYTLERFEKAEIRCYTVVSSLVPLYAPFPQSVHDEPHSTGSL